MILVADLRSADVVKVSDARRKRSSRPPPSANQADLPFDFQRDGEMSIMTRTRGPERNSVVSLLDPFAARQLQNQRFVQRGLSGEVECVEALDLHEARQSDTTLEID